MADNTYNIRSRKQKMVPHITHPMTEENSVELSTNLAQSDTAPSKEDNSKKPNKSKNGRGALKKSETFRNGNPNQIPVKDYLHWSAKKQRNKDDQQRPLLADDDSDGSSENEITEHTEEEIHGTEDSLIVKQDESALSITLQVSLPFIIAGFGTVGAGMVLDIVQHWRVFKEVSEVFILVPALLGLKGNLEMTLASRLSTQANLGNMDTRKEQWKMIGGNMALVQAQAIVVGFLASLVAMVMGWIPDGHFDIHHGLLLCASSIFTASIASLALGSVMVLVVLLSKKCNINPDNVATPIAASLGDLITLSLLSWVSVLLYKSLGKEVWLAPLIIVIFLLLTPLWVYISVKNKYVNDVIYSGWVPVLSAMVISSVGGLILDFTVANYHGIAVFQPVINGVGGNLVAVQASRISTFLHQNSVPGVLPGGHTKACINPIKVFFGKSCNARAARVLICLVIPGQLLFIYTISYMKAGHTSITLIFNVTYLSAALLQVAILLFIADWMVHYTWLKGEDPDNVAIPYLTAIGDLLGTGFLALAFCFLYYIGDRDADVGE
ncbi:solute carrier family 41 member 1 [Patella vulgata]|uniref:solute carrier family 41 member 1 n=1 Tax=Patella vulgata TaxID=6465 RepID=UPI00217F53AE|nr:solute carrier family 41 member 1 [Patella vulgata]